MLQGGVYKVYRGAAGSSAGDGGAREGVVEGDLTDAMHASAEGLWRAVGEASQFNAGLGEQRRGQMAHGVLLRVDDRPYAGLGNLLGAE